MTSIQIRFLSQSQISTDEECQINALDRLVFAGADQDDPQLKDIQWASHDWMAVGYHQEQLVVQFCLLKREILVGGYPLMVAGVGGVVTHPDWRRRGLARQLLLAAEPFMRENLAVPFALLICAEETQQVYASCGWQAVAHSLRYTQDGQSRILPTLVMVLPLAGQAWLEGEIELCGLPW